MLAIYKNGKILTMSGDTPEYVECLVTQDDVIVHVGGLKEAGKYMKENEKEIVDLEGKCLMPGFIDPHIHPSMAGKWPSVELPLFKVCVFDFVHLNDNIGYM